MKNEFLLTFEDGLPKGTSQQKRYNSRTGHYFKDKKLSALEQTFAYALRPHRPKTPSEMPIRLNL
jgi:Holliday junction resolvase RusA-like endonuclease